MLKGNKGEWSEFYAFVKLISDRNLFGADEKLDKILDPYYPIKAIFREESSGVSTYRLKEDNEVEFSRSNGQISIVNSADLKSKVALIFEEIKTRSKAFELPVADELLERFGIRSLKANSSKKEDISLEIYDYRIGKEHVLGFSIKSQLGSAATLLNASSATNFIFRVTGLTSEQAANINGIKTKAKIKDRLSAIYAAGGLIIFEGLESANFEKNLRRLDSGMPGIIGGMLLAYYSGKGKHFSEIAEALAVSDPETVKLGYDAGEYEHKIMDLLYASALGMVPTRVWKGEARAHGGVIIVRKDGEIVHYHIHNADKFRRYLMENTKLDTPSATRHDFGSLFEKGNEMFIRLNLHVRFIQ